MLRDSHSKVVVALTKLARQALSAAGRNDGPVEVSISPMELSARVGLDVDSVKRIVQQQRSITRALSDDFDSVFGKAFARAYEEAIEKLTNEGTPA